MAITIKTKEEIANLREGGKRLADILNKVVSEVRLGISTADLDGLAESLILAQGGVPAFKGYIVEGVKKPYPGTICASVNDEVVHSIPSKNKILQEGDIIGIDIGMRWPEKAGSGRGLFTDMAITVGVGKISSDAARLIRVTREALDIGIRAVRPGGTVGDIGFAIETYLSAQRLGIIRELAGHGVGYELHEEPLIPNYGKRGKGAELREGMVIAIEPMAALGTENIDLDRDEWTFRTSDGNLAAHFEHTIVVAKQGAEVLTR